MKSATLTFLCALLVSCASAPRVARTPPPSRSAPAAPAAKPPEPEAIARDQPRTTAAGHTFTAPAGWTLSSDARMRVLEGPEKDVKLALVDVAHATDVNDAVKQAWAAFDPAFSRPLHIAQDQPGRFGWESARVFAYETSPNEKRSVLAFARRKGGAYDVALVEGADAAMEKRGSQINLILGSVRPAGYKRESFAGKVAHPLDAARIKILTDFIAKAQQAADVPGVAIGLLDHGKVVFAGGFGVRELGKPDKVDANTLFIIASNTKALSTLLLSKEVDRGKFTWDTPVTQVFGDFKLGDADTTKHVLMKHLVCACTGMPREDLPWLFEFKDATPKGSLALLGTFQPTSKFGEVFQYSNLMAAAAGFIGGHLLAPKRELGRAYDEAMRKEVFAPLGMSATTFDFKRALKTDHASPHGENIDGKTAVARMDLNYAVLPVRPAGGAWSSVNDVLKYVGMELAKGKLPDGKPFVSEAALLARRAPQVMIDEDQTYGMGLMTNTRWGVPLVHHGGDLIGYHSDMFWIPDAEVGGVILTNADAGVILRGPFERKVLEVLYDGEPEADEDVMTSIARHKDATAVERKRLVTPPDAAVVAKLASKYREKSLGDITVTKRGADTVFDFGEWHSAMASRKNDDGTVSLFTIEPGALGFEFVMGEKDGQRTLTARDAQHEYVFVEAPR